VPPVVALSTVLGDVEMVIGLPYCFFV
jgi:hypothetical protein